MPEDKLQLFDNQTIRTAWDEDQEEWYFSIVDVVKVLTDQKTPRSASTYWAVLKKRLKEEGADELLTNCKQLKMKATDGKMRKTDVATTEQLLRIIQSIPSPKAEPFKAWLAMVGHERIEETIDPELAFDRAKETYRRKGYSDEWINQRMMAIRTRNTLTDEWKQRGVQGGEFAILTNDIHRTWTGMSTKEHKQFKGLKKENLRDNMSNMELILTMLAEQTTTEISRATEPATFDENRNVAKAGGEVAKNARQDVERRTGKSVITDKNANQLNHIVTDMIETSANTADQTETEQEES